MSSASNTLGPTKPLIRLKACGVLDLCAGAAVILFGLALAVFADWIGIVALLVGIGLWVGSMVKWGDVFVRSDGDLPSMHRS